jgi:uncharacterized membrane protein
MDLVERFWEIDFFRGSAVIMMILYHFIFDLSFFGLYPLNIFSGFFWILPRIIASMFIFLVGISLYLSYTRAEMTETSIHEIDFFYKYLRRGVWIFSLGLLITLVTWIFVRADFIIFGILHFIGLAIILQYPFLRYTWRYKYFNLIVGLILIAAGLYLAFFTFNYNGLLWLGFIPQNLQTLDYFPLLPWLGVMSLGIFFGSIFYQNYNRKFKIPDLNQHSPIRLFSFLGRHSLLIYLFHQPILILFFYLTGVLSFSYFL